MYVALLSTILVLFFLYLTTVVGGTQVDVAVTVPPRGAECPVSTPNAASGAPALDDDDLYDRLYAAAAAPPAGALGYDGQAGITAGGITTLKPFDAFDTTGQQQIEASRGLASVAAAVAQQSKQRAPLEEACSAVPDPCGDDVVWRNSFPGCGSFHIPMKGKDYAIDQRVWQGDLNPKLQERMALLEKEWDPYAHQRSRQAYMQFIATNFSSKSDKYMEAIDDLDDVDATCLNEVEPVVTM